MDASTLHLRCGTDIRDALHLAGIPGEFVEWSDPVCCGPVPCGIEGDLLRRERARFLAHWLAFGIDESVEPDTIEALHARLRSEAEALQRLDAHDPIVLWFEHDWYDQSILIRLLSELGDRPHLHAKLRIVAIDRFPGISRFIGFGQLTPKQLASTLYEIRKISSETLALARALWSAYRSPDPMEFQDAIARLSPERNPHLPFFAAAARRGLLEYPDRVSGLGLTERLILGAFQGASKSPIELFRHCIAAADPQPYYGDAMFWPLLRRLSRAVRPAITPFDDLSSPVELTDFGRAVLEGTADWVDTNGIDLWLGGVHLRDVAPWRWDPSEGPCGRLVKI